MVDSLKQIAIGCDHAGFVVKDYIIKNLGSSGYEFIDFGTFSELSMDYPEIAHPLAKAVQSGSFEFGILICGSGNGVAIVANKYTGIRAAICWNEEITSLARLHNNANIIVLPARFISQDEAVDLVRLFLSTGFEGGRHQRRIDKISNIS
ncbi:MAG: ribose 5-phosphate isomerase B [Bacteroidales bacterium]|nr:ribose 5-phosphate isomerase B [Bacteroidales bacterium]